MSQYKVTLLLGSNLNDPKENIDKAISLIEMRLGKIFAKSKYLYSNPVEFVSFNIFCNIAMSITTQLSPIELLKRIKTIEREMGRELDSKAHGEYKDRVIDIDIVDFDHLNFECQKLTIPHKKHIKERDFSKELLINLKISEKHRL